MLIAPGIRDRTWRLVFVVLASSLLARTTFSDEPKSQPAPRIQFPDDAKPGDVAISLIDVTRDRGDGKDLHRWDLRLRITNTSDRKLGLWRGPGNGDREFDKKLAFEWTDAKGRAIYRQDYRCRPVFWDRVIAPPKGFVEWTITYRTKPDFPVSFDFMGFLKEHALKREGEVSLPFRFRAIAYGPIAVEADSVREFTGTGHLYDYYLQVKAAEEKGLPKPEYVPTIVASSDWIEVKESEGQPEAK